MPGILLFNGCYAPPFDEGVKLVTHHLRREFSYLAPVHMVTSVCGVSGDTVTVPRNPLLFAMGIRRVCRRHRPAAVVYVPDAYLRTLTIARCGLLRLAAGNMPLGMVTLQPHEFSPAVRAMLRLWRPDAVFTYVREDASLYDRFNIRYRLLPPAVDTDKFRPPEDRDHKILLRRRYGLPEDKKILLHVGHVRQSRNLDLLLRLPMPPEAHLVIVGSSSRALEPALSRALVERGATVLADYFPHIEEFYQAADVYLFPVRQRDAAIDLPLSVLEAMACNLAVVTTSFRALSTAVPAAPGLFLTATDDAFTVAVAEALRVGDPQTRAAVAGFSWSSCAATIYNDLLHDSHAQQL